MFNLSLMSAKNFSFARLKKPLFNLLLLMGLMMLSRLGFATEPDPGGPGGIADLANSIASSFDSVSKLIIAASYVAGFGITTVSLFKFKASKDNPQQNPLSTPIILLALGIALVFLPSLFAPAGSTLFAGNAVSGGSAGGNTELPGEKEPG